MSSAEPPVYRGEEYVDHPGVVGWCRAAENAAPRWIECVEIGRTAGDREILMLVIGDRRGDPRDRPTLWLDAGTHAAEWAGVMATLFTVSAWLERLAAGDADLTRWFETHSACVVPCISPDGFQALHEGEPLLRSTLRPPPTGTVRSGWSPRDMDGDGVVRWMRWRHPAGPVVEDASAPLFMRPRTLDDDPGDAFYLAPEGELIAWDGLRWSAAPLAHGLDLNRNFPSAWAPFRMFGMDGGAYPLSAPESRAVVDAFAARPHIGAALSLHTYTGALLGQPYRRGGPLAGPDLDLMEALGRDAVAGTGYRYLRVHPEFTYDPEHPIVGVWADTIATVFGVPGYTFELWDPCAAAGAPLDDPATFWTRPRPETLRALIETFAVIDGLSQAWQPFEHPQLGPVEIGGLDLLRTIQNPPPAALADECRRAHAVAERLRRALPEVEVHARVHPLGADSWRLDVDVCSVGFLPTSALARGEEIGASPPVAITVEADGSAALLSGAPAVELGHLDGWGSLRVGASRHALYPSLPERGQRARGTWTVRGPGRVIVRWRAGRAGCGREVVDLS